MKLEFESNATAVSYLAVGNPAADVNLPNREKNAFQLLQSGVKAAQEGNRVEARKLLLQVVEVEPSNENAWLWLASISDYPEELLVFLNNILNINPTNARALEWAQATKSLLAKNFVQRGVDASNEAQTDLARQCFLQAIVHDERNESAWFWLASVSDSPDEKIAHLQKVLSLNPENETARASLQTAKSHNTESLLRKANAAAISGERAEAAELLREVLKQAPELEEAWILKAYLADSFSEKVTCFEKVLTLNPENDAAISGLASLREMLVRTENKKAQRLAVVTSLTNALDARQAEASADSITADEAVQSEAAPAFEEYGQIIEDAQFIQIIAEEEPAAVTESLPTQELEFMPVETPPADDYFHSQAEASEDAYSANSSEEMPENSPENAEQADTDYFSQESYAPPTDNLTFAAVPMPEVDFALMTSDESENQPVDFAGSTDSDSTETDSVAEVAVAETVAVETVVAETEIAETAAVKPAAENLICPFCESENEPNSFICAFCWAVLTLSNLELLIANTEADTAVVQQAVERMEAEQVGRDLEIHELKMLAVGHVNLKNLRQGILHLQAALRMNPNDVVLGSQINTLKIRLMEIEQQENAQSSMTRGKKIMVVDDSATVRKLISSKLEKSGHDVICAVDGVEALEKIKEFLPDLILLDIMMPQMDGYQVCKFIRGNEATKDVPIVMISGKDGFFDKVRGRMCGTTGYITKPFGPEALMKTVESYII